MDNINVIEILRVGLPGLVFLLSVLSFRLLTKEQEKTEPKDKILKSIKQFMYINIVLAILTMIPPIVDNYVLSPVNPSLEIFKISATADGENLGKGNAAVCINATYANRHLLIKDIETGKAIQVFARSVIPCSNGMRISLTPEDATHLGWAKAKVSSDVDMIPAMPGQQFVL